MKNKITALCCLLPLSVSVFAQTKDEYKLQVESLKIENSKLKTEIAKLKTETPKTKPETAAVSKNNIGEYQDALSDINKLLLYPLFKDKYGKEGIFDRNGYTELKAVKSFVDDRAVLTGIKLDQKLTAEDRKLAEKSLAYLDIFDKYKTVLENEKFRSFFDRPYDEKTAQEFKTELSKFNLDEYGKFKKDRDDLVAKIKDYSKETCALQENLIKFQKSVLPTIDGPIPLKIINGFKSATNFDYIKSVIANVSTNTNLKEKLPCSTTQSLEAQPAATAEQPKPNTKTK